MIAAAVLCRAESGRELSAGLMGVRGRVETERKGAELSSRPSFPRSV